MIFDCPRCNLLFRPAGNAPVKCPECGASLSNLGRHAVMPTPRAGERIIGNVVDPSPPIAASGSPSEGCPAGNGDASQGHQCRDDANDAHPTDSDRLSQDNDVQAFTGADTSAHSTGRNSVGQTDSTTDSRPTRQYIGQQEKMPRTVQRGTDGSTDRVGPKVLTDSVHPSVLRRGNP